MPARNTIEIVINAKDNASQVLSSVINNTQALGNVLAKAAVGGVATATAAVAGFSALALKEFSTFEKGMNEVFTLLPGISQEAMDRMSQQALMLSERLGILPNESIPALYQALSAGVPQDNVFEFLELANAAAIGGVTNLETAVDGITTVVNSYGSDIINAAKASDLMFTTVKLGKTTFDELSASLFNVLPNAAAAGVSFEDVSAAIAAITAQGTPTSVATTRIRGAIDELAKSGTKVSDIFKEIAGKSFQDFMAEGNNLQDALQLLEKYARENNLSISDLFGSIEAGGAALSLTGQGTERFTAALEEMGNAAGATEDAFNTMDRGIIRSLQKLQGAWAALLVNAGKLLEPFVTPFIDGMTAIIRVISNAVESGETLSDWLMDIPSFIRPTIQSFVEFVAKLRQMTLFATKFFENIQDGMGPLNALRYAMIGFFPTETQIRVNEIIVAIINFNKRVNELLQPIKGFIAENVKMQDVLTAIGIAIASVAIPAAIAFAAALAPLIITFVGLVAAVSALRNAWEKNFLGIRDIVEKASSVIIERFNQLRSAFNLQSNIARLENFQNVFDKIIQSISNFVSKIDFGKIFEIASVLWSLASPLGRIKLLIEAVFGVNIFDVFLGAIDKVFDVIQKLSSGMSLSDALGLGSGNEQFRELSNSIENFVSIANSAFNEIVAFIQTTVLPALQEFGNWFLTEALPNVLNFLVSTVIPAIIGGFTSFIDFITNSVIPSLQTLANWFLTDVLPKIVDFVNNVFLPVITSIGEFLINLWNVIQPALENIANWFLNDILPAIASYISNVVIPTITKLGEFIFALWERISPTLISIADWFLNTILPQILDFISGTVLPTLESIGTTILNIWDVISPALLNIVDWFLETALPQIVTFINESVIPVFEGIRDLIFGIWDFIKPTLDALFGWFMENGLPAIVDFISNTVMASIQSLIDLITGIWDTVKGGLESFRDGIANIFNGIIANVIEPLKNSLNGVLGFVNDVLASLGLVQAQTPNLQASVSDGSAGASMFGTPGAADGAIITRPTKLWVGEKLKSAGDFEAVLNSDQLRSIIDEVSNNKPNISITVNSNGGNGQEIADDIVSALRARGTDL